MTTYRYVASYRTNAPGLVECSGLVMSSLKPDVLWAHNDSGNGPQLYALSTTGEHLGTWTIVGEDGQPIQVTDCEDIAAKNGQLFLGDIGGGPDGWRSDVRVVELEEPSDLSTPGPIEARDVHLFRYANNDRVDAESLVVLDGGGLGVVAKSVKRPGQGVGRVYLRASHDPVLSPAFTLPTWESAWTAADISEDCNWLAVRSYRRAYIWELPQLLSGPTVVDLVTEPQGESIALSWDGARFWTLGEGLRQPLHCYQRED